MWNITFSAVKEFVFGSPPLPAAFFMTPKAVSEVYGSGKAQAYRSVCVSCPAMK
jgi:hypothetical protein